MFAITSDPVSVFASGNVLLILAFIIVCVAAVVIYQNRKIESLYKEKDALQERRVQDKIDTSDKYNEVMGEFSRTTELLTRKLVGKE